MISVTPEQTSSVLRVQEQPRFVSLPTWCSLGWKAGMAGLAAGLALAEYRR